MSDKEQTNNNEQNIKIKDQWMIRQCFVYDDEYSECTSIKARFHQLFIYGKTLDCSPWKRDSVNCYKWTEKDDTKAAEEIIQSEKLRRKDRLLGHYGNTVWTKRKEPPENWNVSLPEHMQKEHESSYLYLKSKELKGELPPSFDPHFSLCTIL